MESAKFEVGEERDGARLVLVPRGDIDLATAGDLRSAIERAMSNGTHEVWVDLSQVDFMDSTGLSALVSGHLAGSLAVICPDGAARRALEVSGLHDLLRVYRDRGAARQG